MSISCPLHISFPSFTLQYMISPSWEKDEICLFSIFAFWDQLRQVFLLFSVFLYFYKTTRSSSFFLSSHILPFFKVFPLSLWKSGTLFCSSFPPHFQIPLSLLFSSLKHYLFSFLLPLSCHLYLSLLEKMSILSSSFISLSANHSFLCLSLRKDSSSLRPLCQVFLCFSLFLCLQITLSRSLPSFVKRRVHPLSLSFSLFSEWKRGQIDFEIWPELRPAVSR